MGVTRKQLTFEGKFVQIPNEWVRDARLSRRSRGLLAEIMSHRVGWHISISSLQGAGVEGRDAIRSSLAELLKAGYLTRAQTQDAAGRFNEVEYDLSEPVTADGKSVTGGFTVSGSPADGLPAHGESDTKNTMSLEDHLSEDIKPPRVAKRKAPASALPAGWSPSEANVVFAKANSIDMQHEVGQFRAHSEANDKRQSNWDAAFRLWLGNVVKWRKPGDVPKRDPNAWMNAPRGGRS
jgi:hypothetical protein